jgi:predicted hotdog family 3-hydroxylacyl-ACP dehydratase
MDIKATELIPQREPFVLVDKIVGHSDISTKTTFFIEYSHILCRNGFLIEAGLVENMAQSAAAGAGYKFMAEGKEIPLGFIGSVDKLKIYFLPEAGRTLETEIKIEHKVMNVTLVSCKIEVEGVLAAECGMKIFIMDEE